ncbi:MAG: hypothetical protein COV46_05580 [Deltaproteobacteria bacterium CG11_big_fil_rev_8_21_14_0_20_49_13]|nr:MAG: hypothetical protein COV46_05580 [Deltaproteobacteria bacterium CG11_big_fil_rev_8_21_14_0_20_49_13]
MRILLTGATGFIGARLLAHLAAEVDDIRVFRRPGSPLGSVKNIKFEDFIGDITNEDDVLRAVEGCDVVFHAAAEVAYWDKLNDHQFKVNVMGTKNIVDASLTHKVKRLICTSSVVAIGFNEKGLADETTEYNLEPYKINYCDTKHMAELEVQRGVAEGLDAVIVNPAAVFGPGDRRRFHGHLYGGKVWSHIFYVGGGIATVDIDDVVEGHVRAWKHGRKGERYILANENRTFKEQSALIGALMNRPKPKIKIPSFIIYLLAYIASAVSFVTGKRPFVTIQMAKFTEHELFYSNEKAKRELGMQFKPLSQSIENAIEWMREHGHLKS